jgi:hypothetical protein
MKIGTLVAFAIIGAVLGIATGFAVHVIGGVGHSEDFLVWVSSCCLASEPETALAWTAGGAIVGGAIGYLRSTNSK